MSILSTMVWSAFWMIFDLRRGLQGNHADAVEVVESLGKTVELGLEVLQHLRLHGVATGGGLGLQRWQLVGVEVGERLLAGQYGHFQLAVLLGVLRVHRVVHGDVGHEFGLRGLEGGDEVLHGIVVGQFGYGRDLVERAGHAESADRIGAGEVGRAEAVALPRQLLHRRCFQQVQQCVAFLVQGHQRVGAPHGRRRVDDDHVVLDLLERIRLVHGQIKHM